MSLIESFNVQSIGSFIPSGVANTVLHINSLGLLSSNANLGWNGSKLVVNAGATSIAGYELDGTNNPCITLKTSGVVRGYSPCIATNAGAFFTDAQISDLCYRVEGASNRILYGQGANNSTLSIQNALVGVNTYSPTATFQVNGTVTSRITQIIRAVASQTAALLELQNSLGTSVLTASITGGLTQTNSVNANNDVLIAVNSNSGSSAHSIARFQNNTGLTAGFYFNSSNRTIDVGANGFGFYNDGTLGHVQFSAAGDVFFQTNRASGNPIRLRLYRLTEGVFNDSASDYDLRVRSVGRTHMLHVDANGNGGTGSIGIGGAAYAPAGAMLWVYGDIWQLAAGNLRTLVGESTSFYGSFGWVDSTNIFQMGNSSGGNAQGDMLQFDTTGSVVFNEVGRPVSTRFEGDTNVNLLNVVGSSDRVGVNVASPLAKLHVEHTTEQFRASYDASNYFSVSVGSGGLTSLNSIGGGGFEFGDTLGIFLQSSLGGINTKLQAPAYGSYLDMGYAINLYNGNDGSYLNFDGSSNFYLYTGGSTITVNSSNIQLSEAAGAYLQLSGSCTLQSNVGDQVFAGGGTTSLTSSSGQSIVLDANILMVGMQNSNPMITGAIWYDPATNIVYRSP